MLTTSYHHRRLIAVGLVTAVLVTACGSSDDSSGDESAASVESSSVPTTDVATTAAPTTESVSTTPMAPETTEAAVADDCPPPVEAPTIDPVGAGATEFPPFEGAQVTIPAGRYRTSSLGVSVALDLLTDDFIVPHQIEGAVVATDNPAMFFAMLRSDGYVAQSESGSVLESLDLDTWLTESEVTVISDEPTTVAGLPAREVRIEVPVPAVETGYGVPLNASWGLNEGTDTRLIEIDIGDVEPLVLLIEPDSEAGPEATAQADQIIESLAIGEPGPSLARLYAESPWNVGNLLGGEAPLVAAGCLVPMLAFGGSEFELAAASQIRGSGDEILVIDPDVPYAGVVVPLISLVAPANAADDNGFNESPRGAPIETTADAVALLEAAAYQLTPIESEATLLGAPVKSFEFVGPDGDGSVDLWIPSDHAGSPGNAIFSDRSFRSGQILIAETEVGVLVATLEGETGTDDASLLQDRFDTMVATLRPST